MRTSTTIQGDEELARLLERTAKLPHGVLEPLARAIKVASEEVVGTAVRRRFLGKGPFPASQNKLGVRTGRLSKSIRATKPQVNLRTGEISVSFGSNVVYFKVHEFGLNGQVHVKGHQRNLAGAKTFQRGRLTKAYSERLKKKLKGRGTAASEVRPHGRKVNVPARKPLGTQLEQPSTRAAFLMHIKRALYVALNLTKKM